MSEDEGFRRAILSSPTDTSIRLVYADWLEERSDPRAGCLRLADRLRKNYGPRTTDYSNSFWKSLGQGIQPGWWAEEAARLAEEIYDRPGLGGKTAVLIALALTEANLLFPKDWEGNDLTALQHQALSGFETLERSRVRTTTPEELVRALKTAALGNSEIAEALLTAFMESGKDGGINVNAIPSKQSREKPRVRVQQGLRFPLGEFIGEKTELQQVAVLVSLRPLQAEEVRRVIQSYPQVAACLLCCSPGLDAEGLRLFRDAIRRGGRMILCATSSGRWQDCFEDLAVATEANLIQSEEKSPVEISPLRFGRAGFAQIDSNHLIVEQLPDPSSAHMDWYHYLRQRINETTGDEQAWHSSRLSQFMQGQVTVELYGATTQELEQIEWLGTSALNAGIAAVASGYLPGGGVGFLQVAKACADAPGKQLLQWALEEPTRTLLMGTSFDGPKTLDELRNDESLGLDVLENELPQWRVEGPIDPVRVIRKVMECAIESANRLNKMRCEG